MLRRLLRGRPARSYAEAAWRRLMLRDGLAPRFVGEANEVERLRLLARAAVEDWLDAGGMR